jgi:hypothetical protein
MEGHNPQLKQAILEVVSNQLQMNDPPETKATLNRLISEGYSKQDAKELIGAVLSKHIYGIFNAEHEFDSSKYAKDLENLPIFPEED